MSGGACSLTSELVRRILNLRPLRLLDAGCGEGDFLAQIRGSESHGILIGVDVNKTSLAKARAKALGGGWSERAVFILGDMGMIPLRDATADAIVFRGLLHHLGDINSALDDARRVLARDGFLFIQDGTQMSREDFEEMNKALHQKGLPREVHPGFDPEELTVGLRSIGFVVDEVIKGGEAVFATPPHVPKVYATPLFLLVARRTRQEVSGEDRSSVAIRKARPGDAEAIAKVHVRTWQVAYRGQLPDDVLDNLSVEDRAEMWHQLIRRLGDSDHRVWVAEREGDVVGFVNTGPTRDEDSDSRTTGEVYAIYVLPAFWGQGIGRALMERAVGEMRSQGFRDIALWVLDTSVRTRHFYETAGWRTDGSVRDEMIGGTPAQVVRYRLPLSE